MNDSDPPRWDIDALKRDDPKAWKKVLNYLYPIVNRYVRKCLYKGDFDVVDDLTQETLLTFYEIRNKLQNGGHIVGMACRVAKYKVNSHYRHFDAQMRDRNMEVSFDELVDLPAPSLSYEKILVANQLIQTLPDTHRRVMELWLDKHKSKEIGEIVGINPNTVRNIIFKILRKWRDQYGDELC